MFPELTGVRGRPQRPSEGLLGLQQGVPADVCGGAFGLELCRCVSGIPEGVGVPPLAGASGPLNAESVGWVLGPKPSPPSPNSTSEREPAVAPRYPSLR